MLFRSAAYPMIRYKPDHVGQANFDGSRYIHAFFDTVIDTGIISLSLGLLLFLYSIFILI